MIVCFSMVRILKPFLICASENLNSLYIIFSNRVTSFCSLSFPRTLAQWVRCKAIRISFNELVVFSAALISLPIRTKERHTEVLVIHNIKYTVLTGLCLVFPSVCKVCHNVALWVNFFNICQKIQFFVDM